MDKRRAEIEAKRAKLAELRKARAERMTGGAAGAAQSVLASVSSPSTSKKDIDDLLNNLVGPRGGLSDNGEFTPSSSIPGTPSAAKHHDLPGHSIGVSATGSGRASRQSEDRLSGGSSNFPGLSNSATENLIER